MENKQYALDLAIRAKYREEHPFSSLNDELDQYYVGSNGRVYNRYLPNNEWAGFRNEMETCYVNAYNRFKEGDGGELEEKQYPPKMACYGSSSRFIYLESRDLVNKREDFFEKKLETCVGGTANIDGYLSHSDGHLFIEAKCREIYGSEAKKISISIKYLKLYKYLADCHLIKYIERPHKEKGKIDPNHVDITFFSPSGKSLEHTDIKQLLCHFLGIAAFLLENPSEKRKLSFIYLIFKPEENTNCIFESERMRDSILKIRNVIVPEEFSSLDICSIFNAVVDYQTRNLADNKLSNEQIDEIKKNFSFALCDQHEYYNTLCSLVKQ